LRIEIFEMERMQSTYEFQVDYDMSESGIRPVCLNELIQMGFDLDSVLEMPLGYSQSDGTPEVKDLLSQIYPGATHANLEVTNGTSEANYLIALSQIEPGDQVAFQIPNYMQLWGVSKSLGATVNPFCLQSEKNWAIDWEAFEAAVNPNTRLVYISNPNNPSGAVLPPAAMQRIVERCERMDCLLIADEVYIGAEHGDQRTPSFWGMGDKVIVTSGLSKAYGIPGLRVGWIVGPPTLVAECWSQHDYITIGPNKLSDRLTRVAIQEKNRARLYGRTRAILKENRPLLEAWVKTVPQVSYVPSQAGAFTLLKLNTDTPDVDIVKSCMQNQSTLMVPGTHFGTPGYLRVWFGGQPDYIREGLRRIKAALASY
jgi:aspartate/methionine/tyrosine aminotransferase